MSRHPPVRWQSVRKYLALGAIFVLLSGSSLHAQASFTATRQAEYSVFVGGSSVDTDFGHLRQAGFVAGFDYTRFPHFFVHPGLELRASVSPKGSNVGERVFGGGPKLSHNFGRFAPYVDFLVSTGVVSYTYPQINFSGHGIGSDNSVVYTYGGGVEIAVIRHFSAKVDFQSSHWKLAPRDTFTPNEVGLAVVWHTK